MRQKAVTSFFLVLSLVIALTLPGIGLAPDVLPGPFDALAADCGAHAAQRQNLPGNKTPIKMTGKEIAGNVLNLSEADYFGEAADFGKLEKGLLRSGFEGLAINAPGVVDLAKGRLPVVMAICETTRRQWEVYLDKNLVMVAVSMDSGEVYAGPALAPPEKEPEAERFSRQPPEPKEKPPYTRSAKIVMLQARDRLDMPWKPGRYALALVNYDRVSNVVEAELKGPGEPDKGKAPEVKPVPAADCGKDALPCYDVLPATPRIFRDGLDFVVAAEADRPERLPVYGAFAVKARERYIDRSGTVRQGTGGRGLSVAGVVPVTLMVFGLDNDVPMRFDWGVPVYGPAPAQGGLMKGSFAIDALQGGDARLASGRYMAYIICDFRIFGPKPFKIHKKS